MLKFKKPDFKDTKVKRAAIVLAVAAIGVLAAFTSTTLSLTSQNFFCASACHFLMKYDVEALEKSSHANVQCIACHIPPDIAVFIEHKMAGLGEAKMAILGTYEWPINARSDLAAEIPNENCNDCHSIETRKVTPTKGVTINHKVHIDKGIKCAYCHNRVGHPDLSVAVTDEQLAKFKEEEAKHAKAAGEKTEEKKEGEAELPVIEEGELKVVNGKFTYTNMISMEGCSRCHGLEANAKAPGKCETCHTKDFELKPENHRVAGWLKFSKDHRAEHGKQAKEPDGKRYCTQCHAQKFCQDCHGVQSMPHPESFKVAKGGRAEHAKIGTENPQTCRKCHVEESFCTACHHKDGYKPGTPWVAPKGSAMAHPATVDRRGAESCYKCHDGRYCASCHIQGTPNNAFLSRQR